MESFIVEELPGLLGGLKGPDLSRVSICGHSMGGHGAMTLALKHPGTYSSVSACADLQSDRLSLGSCHSATSVRIKPNGTTTTPLPWFAPEPS